TMRLPSGDQTGEESLAGSNVKRAAFLPATSHSQRSGVLVCGSIRSATKRFSSGESQGLLTLPTTSNEPADLPLRSTQTYWRRCRLTLGSKTSTPLSETEKFT